MMPRTSDCSGQVFLPTGSGFLKSLARGLNPPGLGPACGSEAALVDHLQRRCHSCPGTSVPPGWVLAAAPSPAGTLPPQPWAKGEGKSAAPQWFQICRRLWSTGGEAEGLHPGPINGLDVLCPHNRAGAQCLLVSAVVQLQMPAASHPSPPSLAVCICTSPWLISSLLIFWGIRSQAPPRLGKDPWPVMPQESCRGAALSLVGTVAWGAC